MIHPSGESPGVDAFKPANGGCVGELGAQDILWRPLNCAIRLGTMWFG